MVGSDNFRNQISDPVAVMVAGILQKYKLLSQLFFVYPQRLADMDQMVPVALMLIAMPISSSIGHAIGLGLISYTVIKVFSGKAKDVSVLTYVISALFLVKFFLVV